MPTPIFDQFLQSIHAMNEEQRKDLASFHTTVSKELFWSLLKAKAESIILSRGVRSSFVVDDNNRGVIANMYYYLIGDAEQCEWNIDRGIYLIGAVGCGKSVLMESFLAVSDFLCHKVTTHVHSKVLAELIKAKGAKSLSKIPLYIDELGRENLETNDYGTKVKPVIDLFALRYEAGGRTYATSNFKLDTLEGISKGGVIVKEGYGNFIRTRMEEMFNVVIMTGPNRRVKCEGGQPDGSKSSK